MIALATLLYHILLIVYFFLNLRIEDYESDDRVKWMIKWLKWINYIAVVSLVRVKVSHKFVVNFLHRNQIKQL